MSNVEHEVLGEAAPERVTDGMPELKWSMIVERDEKIAEQQQVIAALVGALKNVRANLRTVPITEPGWSELNAEIFKAAELADALLADHSAAAEAWAAKERAAAVIEELRKIGQTFIVTALNDCERQDGRRILQRADQLEAEAARRGEVVGE